LKVDASTVPYSPKEAGYFIPSITEATEKRCIKVDGQDRCKIAIQSNNVETDERGYIYVVDRANTGMHILELTGDARAIAGSASASLLSRPARASNVTAHWLAQRPKAAFVTGLQSAP